MSMEWENMKGPREVENIKKKEACLANANKYIEIVIDSKRWNNSSVWNEERRNMYKKLGFKKLRTVNEFYRTGTTTYYEITSDTTIQKKTEADYDMKTKYIIGIQRDRVSDEATLKALLRKYENFLSEAKTKFGEVTPKLIDPKTRLKYDKTIQLSVGSLFCPIAIPFVIVYLVLHHKKLNKMAKDYASLLDAYNQKVLDIENEFQAIIK